jgi:CheY-like chemotaxis protein
MSGYEVCQRIRAHPDTEILPVVMVTALDPAQERIWAGDTRVPDWVDRRVNRQRKRG